MTYPYQPTAYKRFIHSLVLLFVIGLLTFCFLITQLLSLVVSAYVFMSDGQTQSDIAVKLASASENGSIIAYSVWLNAVLLVVLVFFFRYLIHVYQKAHQRKYASLVVYDDQNQNGQRLHDKSDNDNNHRDNEEYKENNNNEKDNNKKEHHTRDIASTNNVSVLPMSWQVLVNNKRMVAKLLGYYVVFFLVTEAATQWLNKTPMQFLDGLYATAEPKWVLIIAIAVIAPIYEELIFRGVLWSMITQYVKYNFTYNSDNNTLGIIVASLVSSLLFALVHQQYGFYEMSLIFTFALLLCYARVKTNSLFMPICLHIINNSVAMLLYILESTI